MLCKFAQPRSCWASVQFASSPLKLICLSTVEKLRSRSEETKTNLTQRNAKLEDMLLECRQFEQMNIEFERWIISLEEEYTAQHDTVGHTITALEELIEANKVSLFN